MDVNRQENVYNFRLFFLSVNRKNEGQIYTYSLKYLLFLYAERVYLFVCGYSSESGG